MLSQHPLHPFGVEDVGVESGFGHDARVGDPELEGEGETLEIGVVSFSQLQQLPKTLFDLLVDLDHEKSLEVAGQEAVRTQFFDVLHAEVHVRHQAVRVVLHRGHEIANRGARLDPDLEGSGGDRGADDGRDTVDKDVSPGQRDTEDGLGRVRVL